MPMRGRQQRNREPSDLIQVVLDDATVERLRIVAETEAVELEQLIVRILRRASHQLGHTDGADDRYN